MAAKKAKVALMFNRGPFTVMADTVGDAPGLVIHKMRLFEEGMDKPKPPSWGGWSVTHVNTGKRANPLPLPNRAAAEAYAIESSQVIPWEKVDEWTEQDWTRYAKLSMGIWNSINERFTPSRKVESDESASTSTES